MDLLNGSYRLRLNPVFIKYLKFVSFKNVSADKYKMAVVLLKIINPEAYAICNTKNKTSHDILMVVLIYMWLTGSVFSLKSYLLSE